MTCKSDGSAWDLNRKKDQLEVLSIIDRVKPALIIGSPPCSWFSRLMALNWKNYSRTQRKLMMEEARGLLRFSCQVYRKQLREGRVFLHEHPSTAQSWTEKEVEELLKEPSVIKVQCDMCRYNLQCEDDLGTGLVKKTTSLMTNSSVMGEFLSRRCVGDHRHVHLKGGRRATMAATYTAEFCEAIVEAFKLHVKAERRKKKNLPTGSKKTISKRN